jgi:hypothetical protein
MATVPATLEVLQMLEQVPANECGALVRQRTDGTMAGALLIEHGRVCWAMSDRYPRRLTDLLVAESDTLTSEQINEVFALCRRDRVPLGETLVARGLVSLPVLHRVLFRHTCEALDCLLREDSEPWTWVEHSGYGYHPMLTFSTAELLTGIHALEHPAAAARALVTLRAALGPEQRGFAIQRTRDARLPLAQIGCEDLDLVEFADLATQANDVMTTASTVAIEVVVAMIGERACASWVQDDLLFLILCDGELAFNRLLAQVATLTTRP